MGTTTKILLGLALTGLASGFLFVTGLINVGNLPSLYVALPAGAIFFGLFLISFMLEKESARYDQEHHVPEGNGVTREDAHHPGEDRSLASV